MSKAFKIFAVTILVVAVFATAFAASFFFGQTVAFAADDTQYLYVAPADGASNVAGVSSVPVHDKVTGDIVFFLPESYYVKVLKQDTLSRITFYEIEYLGFGANGGKTLMVYQDEISTEPSAFSAVNTDEKVNNPYPNTALTLKADGLEYDGATYSKVDWKFYFMGETGTALDDDDATNDALTQVFVKAEKTQNGADVQFFAVDKTAFAEYDANANFKIAAHAETIALLQGSASNGTATSTPANTDNSTLLRIILIVGIIVPALILAIMLFRPSKKERYDKARLKNSGERVIYDRDRRIDDDYRPERDEYEQREQSRRMRESQREDGYYDAPKRYEDDYHRNDQRDSYERRDERRYDDYPRDYRDR